MDVWYPIQVKQRDKVGRPDIDSFEAVMMREDRTKGFFISFDYSGDAMSEIQAFFKKTGTSIIALTVKDILVSWVISTFDRQLKGPFPLPSRYYELDWTKASENDQAEIIKILRISD